MGIDGLLDSMRGDSSKLAAFYRRGDLKAAKDLLESLSALDKLCAAPLAVAKGTDGEKASIGWAAARAGRFDWASLMAPWEKGGRRFDIVLMGCAAAARSEDLDSLLGEPSSYASSNRWIRSRRILAPKGGLGLASLGEALSGPEIEPGHGEARGAVDIGPLEAAMWAGNGAAVHKLVSLASAELWGGGPFINSSERGVADGALRRLRSSAEFFAKLDAMGIQHKAAELLAPVSAAAAALEGRMAEKDRLSKVMDAARGGFPAASLAEGREALLGSALASGAADRLAWGGAPLAESAARAGSAPWVALLAESGCRLGLRNALLAMSRRSDPEGVAAVKAVLESGFDPWGEDGLPDRDERGPAGMGALEAAVRSGSLGAAAELGSAALAAAAMGSGEAESELRAALGIARAEHGAQGSLAAGTMREAMEGLVARLDGVEPAWARPSPPGGMRASDVEASPQYQALAVENQVLAARCRALRAALDAKAPGAARLANTDRPGRSEPIRGRLAARRADGASREGPGGGGPGSGA